ncbi:MAG: YciI family protein [Myxococcales bacterium]
MKFMLMMNAPRGDGDWGVNNWKMEELQAHVGFMKTLNRELKKEGVFVVGEGLAMPAEARLVRANPKDNSPEVTDGPFAEAKEFLAGYWIVDVESPEQAYAIAARISLAPGPGGKPMHLKLEVRQVMSAPPVEP